MGKRRSSVVGGREDIESVADETVDCAVVDDGYNRVPAVAAHSRACNHRECLHTRQRVVVPMAAAVGFHTKRVSGQPPTFVCKQHHRRNPLYNDKT
jgi:hypothetical protein